MPREVTVVLKDERTPEDGHKTGWSKAWGHLNAFVQSPIFVFLFGASFATLLPTIKGCTDSADQVALQKAEVQTRADATLIAPFIANLDADKPGKFEASRAALTALESAASAANGGKSPAVYAAVNGAIIAVGETVYAKPPKPDNEATRQAIAAASSVLPPAAGDKPSVDLLTRGTLVYIEAGRDNQQSKAYAKSLWTSLRSASVLAPGVEELANITMPKQTQVRFYHDEDRAKAQQLAEMVSKITNSITLLAKPHLDARPGTLEVWFGTEQGAAK